MLARSGAGIVFVPGVLAHFKIGCIVFRPFMPANGQGIVYAVCPHGTTITLAAQFPASRARLRSPADAASARFWRIERCSRCTELPSARRIERQTQPHRFRWLRRTTTAR